MESEEREWEEEEEFMLVSTQGRGSQPPVGKAEQVKKVPFVSKSTYLFGTN